MCYFSGRREVRQRLCRAELKTTVCIHFNRINKLSADKLTACNTSKRVMNKLLDKVKPVQRMGQLIFFDEVAKSSGTVYQLYA